MNPLAELLAQMANIGELDDEGLAHLLTEIRDEAEQLADRHDDETIELLVQAGDAVEAIVAEQNARETAAADAAERAQAALDRIRGAQEEPVAEDPEPEPEEEADEESTDEEPAEEPEAEVEDAPTEERVPVAATGAPRVSNVRARTRPADARPRIVASPFDGPIENWGLVAAANAPGVQAGARVTRPDQLAQLFIDAWEATKDFNNGMKGKMRLASKGWGPGGQGGERMYGRDRFLTRDEVENERKIKAVVNARTTQYQSIQSAGGICAPVPQTYDLPVLGGDARPVRDTGMVRFGADRGGISTIPPPQLSDVEDSITVWTETNDVTPSSPTTKPCLTITCPNEDDDVVDAIVRCLRTGNFRSRFFPEQLEAWMRLAGTQWARTAETKLLTEIGTGSTQVTSGQVLGAARDVLTTLDRAIARMRNFHRDYTVGLRFMAPVWLKDMMRTDIARQLPTGTVSDTLAVADATINSWFANRGVSWTWFQDGESGQIFGPQGDGALVGWPDTVITYLFPEGTWLFLDGGTLDLGIVRDSTLNSLNDFQMFAESFEGSHFHGVESLRITMDLCPDGSTSAAIDISPCTTGS